MKKVLASLLIFFSLILVGCSEKVETLSKSDYALRFDESMIAFESTLSKYKDMYKNSDEYDSEQYKTVREALIDLKTSLSVYNTEDDELNNLHDNFIDTIQECIYSIDTCVELLDKGNINDPNVETELEKLNNMSSEMEDDILPIIYYLEENGISFPS